MIIFIFLIFIYIITIILNILNLSPKFELNIYMDNLVKMTNF